jgi:hypothetical protein
MSCGVAGAVSNPDGVMEPAETDQVTLVLTAPVTAALYCPDMLLTVTLVGPLSALTTTGITLMVVLIVAAVPTVFVELKVKIVAVLMIPVGYANPLVTVPTPLLIVADPLVVKTGTIVVEPPFGTGFSAAVKLVAVGIGTAVRVTDFVAVPLLSVAVSV